MGAVLHTPSAGGHYTFARLNSSNSSSGNSGTISSGANPQAASEQCAVAVAAVLLNNSVLFDDHIVRFMSAAEVAQLVDAGTQPVSSSQCSGFGRPYMAFHVANQ
jgi:hypothetical protein